MQSKSWCAWGLGSRLCEVLVQVYILLHQRKWLFSSKFVGFYLALAKPFFSSLYKCFCQPVGSQSRRKQTSWKFFLRVEIWVGVVFKNYLSKLNLSISKWLSIGLNCGFSRETDLHTNANQWEEILSVQRGFSDPCVRMIRGLDTAGIHSAVSIHSAAEKIIRGSLWNMYDFIHYYGLGLAVGKV